MFGQCVGKAELSRETLATVDIWLGRFMPGDAFNYELERLSELTCEMSKRRTNSNFHGMRFRMRDCIVIVPGKHAPIYRPIEASPIVSI